MLDGLNWVGELTQVEGDPVLGSLKRSNDKSARVAFEVELGTCRTDGASTHRVDIAETGADEVRSGLGDRFARRVCVHQHQTWIDADTNAGIGMVGLVVGLVVELVVELVVTVRVGDWVGCRVGWWSGWLMVELEVGSLVGDAFCVLIGFACSSFRFS